MNQPVIVSIGTTVPPHRYSQEQLRDYYTQLNPSKERLTKVVFESAHIDYRHIVIEDMMAYWSQPRSTAERNDYYVEKAVPLGRAAVEKALDKAGLVAQDIHDFIVVSCT